MPAEVKQETRVEYIPCPVCHASEGRPYVDIPDRFQFMPDGRFHLLRCHRCSLVYLNPRPIEQESVRFYQQPDYLPFAASTGERVDGIARLYNRLRRWNCRWKRRQIEKWVEGPARILDVGCGTGEFLDEMVRHGWDGRGIERDPAAVYYAIEQLKLRVYAGTLETAPLPDGRFDVITLWHVLEHLYHPHQTMARLRALLAPGGLLVLAVPNIDSLDARLYGDRWVALDVPRHVQLFNLKSLQMLCHMHKFSLAACKHLPLDSLFNTFMSENLQAAPIWGRGIRLLRAAGIAKLALLAGALGPKQRRFYGSTLLTFWRKKT